MKKIIFFLIILACFTISWSCKKKSYDQALPVVEFVSATPVGNDSLLITGKITNVGASPVEYVGFAYDVQPSFNILTNQRIMEGSSENFSIAINTYQDSTYYIKCFAANSYGYTVTDNTIFKVPIAPPQTAPCANSFANNTVTDGSFNYNMGYMYCSINPTWGDFSVTTSANNTVLGIYFVSTAPVNGIYTTASLTNLDYDPNKFHCAIVFNNYVIKSDYKLYVAKNIDGKVTLSFCSLPYGSNSTTHYLSGKFTY